MAMNMDKASLLMYETLVKALQDGEVTLDINYDYLNNVRSPVYNPWESVLPLVIILTVSLVLMLIFGIIAGMIAMVIGLLLYRFFLKPVLQRKLLERLNYFLCVGYHNWSVMWDLGGFSLVRENTFKTRCEAPKGNWKEFVALNLTESPSAERAINE